MAGISVRDFAGIAPATTSILLPDNAADIALNCDLEHGDYRAFRSPRKIMTPSKVGVKKTIYRFGQNLDNESQYWFHWLDMVDVVKGQIAGDTEELTYFTGDTTYGHPRFTSFSSALMGGGDTYPLNSFRLGIPAPITAPVATATGTGSGTPETRVYVVTFVGTRGEEGPPSPPVTVTVIPGQAVVLDNLPSPPSGYAIGGKRLYRTLTGNSSGTNYQYVADLTSTQLTYTDTIAASALGETMTTLNYLPPPDELAGIKNMPNGIMIGYVGNDIYACEPYKPYAWPTRYIQTIDYPVVGFAVFGEFCIICTKGTPYVMSGADSASLSLQKLEVMASCVAKRSIVSTGYGAMYASPMGLVLATPSQANIVTNNILNREDWQALNPSSIHGYFYDGKYIGFYDNGTQKGGFIFNLRNPKQPFVLIDVYATAGYVDVAKEALYLQIGNDVMRWADGDGYLEGTWRSKKFRSIMPLNYGFAQVLADVYPVKFAVFADGRLVGTNYVTSSKAFRLKAGFKARDWQIEIGGKNRVTQVILTQAARELAQT